jgi:predicted DNA-binding transcriptional regulator AlpA
MQTESDHTCYQLPNTGFVRLNDVLKVIPVSKSTWWKGIQDGRFPKPVKLTERTTAWRVADILKLIDEIQQGAA